jgi:hypothetical protein
MAKKKFVLFERTQLFLALNNLKLENNKNKLHKNKHLICNFLNYNNKGRPPHPHFLIANLFV